MVTHLCVKKFVKADRAPTAADIARELNIPIPLVRSLLTELTESRLLSEVCLDHCEQIAYQPACDVDRLTVAAVMERLEQRGIDAIPIEESISLTKLRETLQRFREMNQRSSVNLKLAELLDDAPPKQPVI
jgi:membrane protein